MEFWHINCFPVPIDHHPTSFRICLCVSDNCPLWCGAARRPREFSNFFSWFCLVQFTPQDPPTQPTKRKTKHSHRPFRKKLPNLSRKRLDFKSIVFTFNSPNFPVEHSKMSTCYVDHLILQFSSKHQPLITTDIIHDIRKWRLSEVSPSSTY